MTLRIALPLVACLLVACGNDESPTPTVTDTGTTEEQDTGAAVDSAESDTEPGDTERPDYGDPWEGGAPSAECVAHCECMKTACAAYSGYPYIADKECTDHCGRFSADELKCWSYFCDEAKKTAGGTKQHNCQHAWGTWGLEECPK